MNQFAGNEADGLLQWAEELGVKVMFQEIERYPTSGSALSLYEENPPTITIFRYKPWEDWLQTVCEDRLRYFNPWFMIPLALELYRHLETHGLYRHRAAWYDVIGRWSLTTIDRRAEAFAQQLLAIPHSPRRFIQLVRRALSAPGSG